MGERLRERHYFLETFEYKPLKAAKGTTHQDALDLAATGRDRSNAELRRLVENQEATETNARCYNGTDKMINGTDKMIRVIARPMLDATTALTRCSE